MKSSHAAALIAERLPQDLDTFVHTARDAGKSWQRIALDLYAATGVLVSDETVRRWFNTEGNAA